MTLDIPPRARLRGDARTTAAQDAAQRYAAGATIRSIAAHLERSYGCTRILLLEAGVQLRDRGGRLRKTNA